MSNPAIQAKRPVLGWTIHDALIIARATITASFGFLRRCSSN